MTIYVGTSIISLGEEEIRKLFEVIEKSMLLSLSAISEPENRKVLDFSTCPVRRKAWGYQNIRRKKLWQVEISGF